MSYDLFPPVPLPVSSPLCDPLPTDAAIATPSLIRLHVVCFDRCVDRYCHTSDFQWAQTPGTWTRSIGYALYLLASEVRTDSNQGWPAPRAHADEIETVRQDLCELSAHWTYLSWEDLGDQVPHLRECTLEILGQISDPCGGWIDELPLDADDA